MSASRVETVERPRREAPADVRHSHFLVRTSHFLKKVSNIRSTRRQSTDGKQLGVPDVFQRTTRSMDLGPKDLAVLTSQHTAPHMDRNSDTPSPSGRSSENGPESLVEGPSVHLQTGSPRSASTASVARSGVVSNSVPSSPQAPEESGVTLQSPNMPPGPTTIANAPVSSTASTSRGTLDTQTNSRRRASTADPARSEAVSNSALSVAQVPEQSGIGLESRSTPPRSTAAPHTHSQQTDVVAQPSNLATTSQTTLNAFAMGAPATSENSTPNSSPVASSSAYSQAPLTPGRVSPGLSDRRNLAPRLATLPPPMMASYMAKGSARLTPSIVSRQPPMPVLSLPPLPPVTPSQQPQRPSQQAPLRSIPALPMRGPSEAEADEADHDNSMLDEDDEDEEVDDDMDASPGAGANRNADAEGAGSDDEMEDSTEMGSAETPRSRGDRAGGLPEIEASRLQTEVTESLRGTVYFTPKPEGQSTPRLRPGSSSSAATDYFTSKRPDKQADRADSPVRTPRPADFFGSPALRTAALGHAQHIAAMPPGSPGRPGLYHLGSRSMVDLLSMAKKGKQTATSPSMVADALAERRSKPLPGAPPAQENDESTPKPSTEPQDILPTTPTLRRQRSLPLYKVSSDPPPYPSFHPRKPGPAVQPRDEEGMERLPPYSNSIYLTAVMPRKVEFTSPGVQAKDRKWRRVLCVLEGTAFKVYKCPPSIAGVSAIESWWEKKVGVGDITVVNTGAVTQSGIRVSAVRGRADSERTGKEDTDPASPDPNARESEPPPPAQQTPPPTRSKLRLPGSLLHPNRSNNSSKGSSTPSRLSVSSSQSSTSSQTQRRRSMEPSQDDHSSISAVARASSDTPSRRTSFVSSNATSPRSATSNRSSATSPPASDSSSFFRSRILHASPPADAGPKQPPEPSERDMIRKYTLQQAESGLASDYGKRKNVIRVRMEGEQFLLQAPDVAAVIDWIEGIQAATNISLDLDERSMPKGPMFPRRRRRRARPQGVAAGTAAATATNA